MTCLESCQILCKKYCTKVARHRVYIHSTTNILAIYFSSWSHVILVSEAIICHLYDYVTRQGPILILYSRNMYFHCHHNYYFWSKKNLCLDLGLSDWIPNLLHKPMKPNVVGLEATIFFQGHLEHRYWKHYFSCHSKVDTQRGNWNAWILHVIESLQLMYSEGISFLFHSRLVLVEHDLIKITTTDHYA